MKAGPSPAQPVIMGVLNVTPDSFSNAGEHYDPGIAIAHGLQLAAEGAGIIDVGGESTRPGAVRIDAAEQLRRTLPVIRALRRELPAQTAISIDTTLADVAEAALESGATIVNDIAAGGESDTLGVAARHGAPIVLMHMQGTPATMQADPRYGDVVAEVLGFLRERADAAQRAGIPKDDVWLDPGIGFGKTRAHNLALVANLATFVATGHPIVLGTSRKRFMGSITRETDFRMLVGATCATTAIGVEAGVSVFRVHDVRPNRQAMEVALALREAQSPNVRGGFQGVRPLQGV